MYWFQTGLSSAWCARQPFMVLRQKLLHGLVLVSPRHRGQCVILTSPRTHASVGGICNKTSQQCHHRRHRHGHHPALTSFSVGVGGRGGRDLPVHTSSRHFPLGGGGGGRSTSPHVITSFSPVLGHTLQSGVSTQQYTTTTSSSPDITTTSPHVIFTRFSRGGGLHSNTSQPCHHHPTSSPPALTSFAHASAERRRRGRSRDLPVHKTS